jgi:hypothetical protein
LSVEELGAPIDVLWFRMSRRATDPQETMGRFLAGAVFVMIQRGTTGSAAWSSPRAVSTGFKPPA